MDCKVFFPLQCQIEDELRCPMCATIENSAEPPGEHSCENQNNNNNMPNLQCQTEDGLPMPGVCNYGELLNTSAQLIKALLA